MLLIRGFFLNQREGEARIGFRCSIRRKSILRLNVRGKWCSTKDWMSVISMEAALLNECLKIQLQHGELN